MKQAYDFAVEHVGIDFHSTTLWADYINFLKSEYVANRDYTLDNKYCTVLL